MTMSTVTPEIVAFAQGVRAAMTDLPADEVDELTEGLEADLAEAYAEDLQRELPDPAEYAAELRLAAGLPGREPPARRGLFSGLADSWRETRRDVVVAVRRNPALASMLDFLGELRPAWWVVRAWLATWLVASFFGMERGYWFDGVFWLVLVAFVVVSVQWGRKVWHRPGVPALVVVGNVIAAVVLLPVLTAAADWDGDYMTGFEDGVAGAADPETSQGVSMDGHVLENIYAYDAEGRRLHDVQLFDVDGNPIETNRSGDENSMVPTPATLETGAKVYNVYPLEVTKMMWDGNGNFIPEPTPDPDKTKAFRDGPFLKVPAVRTPREVAQDNE